MTFTRTSKNGMTTYMSPTDYSKPIAFAVIAVGHKRRVSLTWYDTKARTTRTEPAGLKTVKAAMARVEQLEQEASR